MGIMHFPSEKNFQMVFKEYYPKLCIYAYRVLKNTEDAEDVVQNVFVGIWNKKISLSDKAYIKTYLYRSVFNACLDFLKHQKYVDRKMSDFDPDTEVNDGYLFRQIESEVMEELFRVVDLLPDECKRVFKLSYLEGYDVAKVAAELGVSENTVKTQRARARKFLKERLKNLYPLFLLVLQQASEKI